MITFDEDQFHIFIAAVIFCVFMHSCGQYKVAELENLKPLIEEIKK